MLRHGFIDSVALAPLRPLSSRHSPHARLDRKEKGGFSNIHHVPLCAHERFIGFLIEHYAGNFPLWLAPEQVRILPIGDEAPLIEYARAIQQELRAHGVRTELDASSDHMKAKIFSAEQMKVHTLLVIGRRDMEANAVSVRVYGQGNLSAKPRDEVIADLLATIKDRRAENVDTRALSGRA
jgi:threonyl-tRNA synthetase